MAPASFYIISISEIFFQFSKWRRHVHRTHERVQLGQQIMIVGDLFVGKQTFRRYFVPNAVFLIICSHLFLPTLLEAFVNKNMCNKINWCT